MDHPAPRLTSAMLVSALIRRVQVEGGFGTVIQHGDDQAGAILLECADRGQVSQLLERVTDIDGRQHWRPADANPSADPAAYQERLDRRRNSDPDLWIVELDIADAGRFAAETIGLA